VRVPGPVVDDLHLERVALEEHAEQAVGFIVGEVLAGAVPWLLVVALVADLGEVTAAEDGDDVRLREVLPLRDSADEFDRLLGKPGEVLSVHLARVKTDVAVLVTVLGFEFFSEVPEHLHPPAHGRVLAVPNHVLDRVLLSLALGILQVLVRVDHAEVGLLILEAPDCGGSASCLTAAVCESYKECSRRPFRHDQRDPSPGSTCDG
jgi:hypothetical protein